MLLTCIRSLDIYLPVSDEWISTLDDQHYDVIAVNHFG